MKLVFFFFFTVSTLLGAHHARHLHDGRTYQSFNERPPAKTAELIQMVTREEDSQSQEPTVYGGRPSPKGPPSDGQTIYGGDNPKAPSSPSEDDTIYGRDNPKAPPPPKVAPSQGQAVYVGDKLEASPSPPIRGSPPEDDTIYGRDNPKAPPPPKVAPCRGQTTYGGDSPKSIVADVYVGDKLEASPSPIKGSPPEKDASYGRYNPKAPPPPKVAPSSPSLKPDSSGDRKTYGRDDPTTPPTPDSNDPHNQGMYGGSSFADSTSTFHGRRSRIPPRATAFTSYVLIKKDDDQLLSIASHWLLSYITRRQ